MKNSKILLPLIILGLVAAALSGCLVPEKTHNATVRDLERVKVLLANAEREQIRERNRFTNQLTRCREGHKGLGESCSTLEDDLKGAEGQLAHLHQTIEDTFGAGQPAITLAYRNLVADGEAYLTKEIRALPDLPPEPVALEGAVDGERNGGGAEDGMNEGGDGDEGEVLEAPAQVESPPWQNLVTVSTAHKGNLLKLSLPYIALFDDQGSTLNGQGEQIMARLLPLLKVFTTWQVDLAGGFTLARPEEEEPGEMALEPAAPGKGETLEEQEPAQGDTGDTHPGRVEAGERGAALTALRLGNLKERLEGAGLQVRALATIATPLHGEGATAGETGILPGPGQLELWLKPLQLHSQIPERAQRTGEQAGDQPTP